MVLTHIIPFLQKKNIRGAKKGSAYSKAKAALVMDDE